MSSDDLKGTYYVKQQVCFHIRNHKVKMSV